MKKMMFPFMGVLFMVQLFFSCVSMPFDNPIQNVPFKDLPVSFQNWFLENCGTVSGWTFYWDREGKLQGILYKNDWQSRVSYGNSYSTLTKTYGDYAKFQTLRFKWQLKQEVDRLLREDKSYRQIIELAKVLCDEIDYDWNSFSGYKGPRVARGKAQKLAVCDGYAEEAMNRFLALDVVKSVEKWIGPNHAWNVLKLVDGRTLYVDLTWFDNEHINEQTGERVYYEDYDWENITFDEELFRFSNVGYGSKIFSHNEGKFNKEISRSSESKKPVLNKR
ncbi:MAG: hypothetical protein LBC52_07770 [Treponema sp.]|jgi:hypothetical protein|nr:hypothetical protein [Treponema sp.]